MSIIQVKDKQFKLFIPQSDISGEINRLAGELEADLKEKNPVFICVLTGAFMFATELIKRFNGDCEVVFTRLKSYRGTSSSGNVEEIQGIAEDIEGRDVVIIEDIIESGTTVAYLLNKLQQKNPASIKVASLFFKPHALKYQAIKPDYVAFEIENDFIVGYGLDYENQGRNLTDVYVVVNKQD